AKVKIRPARQAGPRVFLKIANEIFMVKPPSFIHQLRTTKRVRFAQEHLGHPSLLSLRCRLRLYAKQARSRPGRAGRSPRSEYCNQTSCEPSTRIARWRRPEPSRPLMDSCAGTPARYHAPQER